ncbi:head-tail connector protein [Streptomyces sp. NPDC014802]|uniref:head-tail connector protein n=1 Tax=Streptomyces sp. NPDC014802 TaxID=3364917 RepID=UPI0036F5F8DA
MGIVTLAAAKAQLNIAASDTGDDVELQGYIDAATAAIEKQLGLVIDPRTVIDEISCASGTRSLLLQSVPVLSLTSVTSLDGSQSWAVGPSVMRVDSASGLVTVLSGPALSGTVLVTYQAGTTVIPANWRLATLIVIQHLWETQRGRAGAVPGGSDEPEYFPGRGFAIPRRAVELLETTLPGVA